MCAHTHTLTEDMQGTSGGQGGTGGDKRGTCKGHAGDMQGTRGGHAGDKRGTRGMGGANGVYNCN